MELPKDDASISERYDALIELQRTLAKYGMDLRADLEFLQPIILLKGQ